MVKSTLRKKSVKDTVQFIASKNNISKKIIYQMCLEINEKKIINFIFIILFFYL